MRRILLIVTVVLLLFFACTKQALEIHAPLITSSPESEDSALIKKGDSLTTELFTQIYWAEIAVKGKRVTEMRPNTLKLVRASDPVHK